MTDRRVRENIGRLWREMWRGADVETPRGPGHDPTPGMELVFKCADRIPAIVKQTKRLWILPVGGIGSALLSMATTVKDKEVSASAALLAVCGVLLLTFLFIVTSSRRRIGVYQQACTKLHELSERARSGIVYFTLLHMTSEKMGSEQQAVFEKSIPNYCDDLATIVAETFRLLTQDKSLCCSFRVAVGTDPITGDRESVYTTLGRSKGIDSVDRRRNSCPIRADEGIAKHLRERQERRKCTIIRHLPTAIKEGIWQRPDERYRNYPLDVEQYSSVIVCPINAVDHRDNRRMIGMIYLTSKNNPFNGLVAEQLSAIADALPPLLNALFLSSSTAKK